MIISATFSKPSKSCEEKFGRPYLRAKIRVNSSSSAKPYQVEFFTEKQAFHSQFSEEELNVFIEENAGKTFKNAVIRTDYEEITYLANKKGEIRRLVKKLAVIQKNNGVSEDEPETSGKPLDNSETSGKDSSGFAKGSAALRMIQKAAEKTETNNGNRIKNYIIPEGKPVPFLVYLGVMNDAGKVLNSRYDKFRQINRFLEFIDDVVPVLEKLVFKEGKQVRPVRVRDFGCGKSYLTFAVHYFLTEIKKLEVQITGLDLKKDVIEFCNRTAKVLDCKGLSFDFGNIQDYDSENLPDMVVTLHACDTATDFALDYGVKKQCPVILSVPCCQHEINGQLNENLKLWKNGQKVPEEFSALLKYGLIKERFAALLTDSLRCEYLENQGYTVQVLEFIDMESTPKNLLIRAVKNNSSADETKLQKPLAEAETVINRLEISPSIKKLLVKA